MSILKLHQPRPVVIRAVYYDLYKERNRKYVHKTVSGIHPGFLLSKHKHKLATNFSSLYSTRIRSPPTDTHTLRHSWAFNNVLTQPLLLRSPSVNTNHALGSRCSQPGDVPACTLTWWLCNSPLQFSMYNLPPQRNSSFMYY